LNCFSNISGSGIQRLLRHAIHLHNQRQNVLREVLLNRIERIEKCFDRLLSQNLDSPDERRLQRCYRKYRDAPFIFLYRTDVAQPIMSVSDYCDLR
jgi:hypothetical protein